MTDRCTFLLWTGVARGVPRQRRRATPGLRGRPHVCSVCATLPRVPRRNQPFLKKVLLDDWEQLGVAFQEFLIQQGLSSNMWIVARKSKS